MRCDAVMTMCELRIPGLRLVLKKQANRIPCGDRAVFHNVTKSRPGEEKSAVRAPDSPIPSPNTYQLSARPVHRKGEKGLHPSGRPRLEGGSVQSEAQRLWQQAARGIEWAWAVRQCRLALRRAQGERVRVGRTSAVRGEPVEPRAGPGRASGRPEADGRRTM